MLHPPQKPRDYEVYDACLKHLYPQGCKRLVISPATIPRDHNPEDFIRDNMPHVGPSTLADFAHVGGLAQTLRREFFECSESIQFMPQPASDAYGLPEIRADFPEGDGIIYFTVVGFSDDGKEALVAVDTFPHQTFPNGGFGYYLAAQLDGGSWSVTDDLVAWIA